MAKDRNIETNAALTTGHSFDAANMISECWLIRVDVAIL